MDLENSRDDLLYELHKLPHQNPNDTGMLKEYFSDVQTLSDNLGSIFDHFISNIFFQSNLIKILRHITVMHYI